MSRRSRAWLWLSLLVQGWLPWAVVGVGALGVVLIIVSDEFNDPWRALCVEVGGAFVLVVPIVLLERAIEVRIDALRRLAEQSIEDVRSEVAVVRRDVQHVQTQIAELGRATAQRIADARVADSELVEAFRGDVSLRNTWHLLRRADELGALDERGVRVRLPGSTERVRFKALEDGAEGEGRIRVDVETAEGDRLVDGEAWTSGEPAEQMFAALAERLHRAGSYPGDDSFDAAAVFERLADTLATVLALRTGAREGPQLARVVELAGEWAITSFGLEHLEKDERDINAAQLRSSSDQASVRRDVDADVFGDAVDYHRGEHRRAAAERLHRGG